MKGPSKEFVGSLYKDLCTRIHRKSLQDLAASQLSWSSQDLCKRPLSRKLQPVKKPAGPLYKEPCATILQRNSPDLCLEGPFQTTHRISVQGTFQESHGISKRNPRGQPTGSLCTQNLTNSCLAEDCIIVFANGSCPATNAGVISRKTNTCACCMLGFSAPNIARIAQH